MTPTRLMRTLDHRGNARRAPRAQCLCGGFTLIEMLVVMTLISLLLTLAVPRYFGTLDHGRLRVQQQNIATLRDAIDKFHADQGRYPDDLEEIVSKKYLRQIPVDPVTENTQWVIVPPADGTEGNVYDVQGAAAPVPPTVVSEGN